MPRNPFKRTPKQAPPPEMPPAAAAAAGVEQAAISAPPPQGLTTTEERILRAQNPSGDPLQLTSSTDPVLGRLDAPQPLERPRGEFRNVNLDRLDTDEGVEQLLDAVSLDTQNAGYSVRTWDEMRGETMAQVRAKAEAEGLREGVTDPAVWDQRIKELTTESDRDLLKKMIGRKPGQLFNDTQLTRARGMMVASAQNLVDWGRRLKAQGSANISDMDRIEYQRALYRHAALQTAVQGATRDTARALNALKAVPDQFDMQALEEIINAGGGRDAIWEKIVKVADSQTLEEASVNAGKVAQMGKLAEKLVYFRTMNLLSAPTTHIKNAVGNALVNVLSMPERALAGVISQTVGSGEVFPREAAEMFLGDVEGILDGVRLAGKAWKTSDSAFGGTKIESNRGAVHSASEYGLEHGDPMAVTYDYLASIISAPGRALTAADEFYKSAAFNSQLRARAYRAAKMEGLADPDQIGARMDEILAGPNQENLLAKLASEGLSGDDLDIAFMSKLKAEERLFREIYEDSIQFARYQTFTDEITSGVGKGLAQIHRDSPAFRLIVPFYRTPANILSYAVERSPVFALAPNFWKSVQAGGAKRDEAMARAVIGTAFAAWAISAAMDGSLSGSGPANPQMRKVYEELGWKPYQLGKGEEALSYAGLEPFTTVLAVTGDLADYYRHATSDKQREHIMVVMAAAFAEAMQDKAMLTGFSDLADALMSAKYGGSTNYLGKLAQSFIPYSQFLRRARTNLDPQQRETQVGDPLSDALAYVRNSVPVEGLYDDLPPKLDFWGEPLAYGEFVGPDFLSPFQQVKYKDDDATYALAQNGVAPSAVSCEISVEGVAIDLHSIETGKGPGFACHEYRELVGKSRRRAVTETIKEGAYKSLPIGGANASEMNPTRGDLLTMALTDGLNAGREQFIERYSVQVEQALREGLNNVRPVSPPPGFIEQNRERERQRRSTPQF